MIEFPCHCGHQFTVTDDMAGNMIQCPQCKRLNDVPTLGELQNLDTGGMYKLDEAPKVQNDPERVAELTYVFTRHHFDGDGNPIDLRGPAQHGKNPAGPVPVEAMGPLEAAVPKYDPLTGELVEPIELKPDPRPDPAAVPVARLAIVPPRTIVDGMDVPKPKEVFAIPFRLLMPANLLVMFFVLLGHAVGVVITSSIFTGMAVLAIPVWVVWHALMLSHYGNVVDELGPASRGELPTPLRHIGWHEDIWDPLVEVVLAMAICLLPGLLVLVNMGKTVDPIILSVSASLLVVGMILFPATVLTTTTSGSIMNARPDRLFGVVWQCGMEYAVAAVTWIVGCVVWVYGLESINRLGMGAWLPPSAQPPMPKWYVAWGIMALGTYMMHFFCWHLGTLYRKHYARFPWVLQRHERARLAKPTGFPVARPHRPRRPSPPAAQPVEPASQPPAQP